MIRVKITKDGKYKKGETVYLSKNEAFGLIDAGFAVLSKDMVNTDYSTKTPYKGSRKS